MADDWVVRPAPGSRIKHRQNTWPTTTANQPPCIIARDEPASDLNMLAAQHAGGGVFAIHVVHETRRYTQTHPRA